MKMESPPSSSTWSEAFILSDDSGLLLTSSSISSSGSASGDSRSGPKRLHLELQDSDCEEKSLSQDDSLDGMSDIICGENFNTLKKGPHWIPELPLKTSPIEPPPEFQDKPVVAIHVFESFAEKFAATIVSVAVKECYETELKCLKLLVHRPLHHVLTRAYWTPDFLPFSPCHGGRPSSRSSLGSSRLSSSHNSLSVPTAHRVDDSSFITQAVSHDTLTFNPISDLYNVPFDSDVYAVPVDVVKPPLKPRRNQQHKKRRRNTSSGCREIESRHCKLTVNKKSTVKCDRVNMCTVDKVGKRHSVPSTSAITDGEPIHMTLQEVRQYLQTLYSSSSDSSDHKDKINNIKPKNTIIVTNNNNNNKYTDTSTIVLTHKPINGVTNSSETHKSKKNTFLINIKNKKVKDSCDNVGKQQISVIGTNKHEVKRKKSPAKLFSLKQTLCNMFRFRKFMSPEHLKNEHKTDSEYESNYSVRDDETHSTITNRALPPLPSRKCEDDDDEQVLDFATSIHKVKDYGWYWGPLSSEAAEKILSNEPDGSFIVRDSSDDHYIFSLTFKLNNSVRHVRIEHDQGNFSFGSCTKFKSQTIVEFIENAVEHSRSGRYLFFLHRRPVIGPVRVQLLHPVSRFKQIQSLQHMCRFIILKAVRRDLIPSLPLPRRMIDYLNTPHYYSEHLIDIEECDETNVTQPIRTVLTDVVPPQRHNNIETHIEWPPNPDVPVNNYVLINNPATNPNTFNDTRQS